MPILRPRVVSGEVRAKEGRIAISAAPERDGVISANTKWIPIEIIGFYEGITTPFGNDLARWLIYAIVAGAIVTFLWIAFATESAKAKSRIAGRQVTLSCFAFIFLGRWHNKSRYLEGARAMVASWHQSCCSSGRRDLTPHPGRYPGACRNSSGLK